MPRVSGAPRPSLSPEGTIPLASMDIGRSLDGGRSFEIEVCAAVAKWGASRVALWTSTPGEVDVLGTFQKVHDWREASRRWDSLNSNVIRRRPWVQWAMVMQRHRDGGVHFHACVIHESDVRGELDFDALRRRDYRSANLALRAEWAVWRQVAPRYGFGRVEFMPVYDGDGLGRYLARYLRREIGKRREADTRAQLFRFSRSWERAVKGEACWADMRAKRARRRGEIVGNRLWGSLDAMVDELGAQWRWKLKRLLWCADDVFPVVLEDAADALQYAGGALVAIDEAFAKVDRRMAEGQKVRAGYLEWLGRCGHGEKKEVQTGS